MRLPASRWVLFAGLLLAIAPGCQSLYRPRPLAIEIRDAETQQPIPGAVVHMSNSNSASTAAVETTATTGPDGILRRSIVPNGQYVHIVQASARGYASETLTVADTSIENLKPAGWFEKVEQRPVDYVMNLYAEPKFSIQFTLPAGFRGLVKAEMRFQENLPLTRGQRAFSFPVDSYGKVQVTGPLILKRVPIANYSAKDFTGVVLENKSEAQNPVKQVGLQTNTDPGQVGFHWLKHDDGGEYFVVGNAEELERFRKEMLPGYEPGVKRTSPGNASSGGKSGKRRGGGGGGTGIGGGGFGSNP